MVPLDTVKVGVVGAGVMGNYHLKTYMGLAKENPFIQLVGLYDINQDRAKQVSDLFKIQAFSSLQDLADNIDVASVTTPTSNHLKTADYLLSRRIACLVEKPLAVSIGEGEQLISSANKAGVPLQVGHIELFNPAVQRLRQVIKEEKATIYYISAERMSENTGRGQDTSVILDLMIHDIYVLQSLIAGEVGSICAKGFKQGRDLASALVDFPKGEYASLTASRMGSNKSRYLDIYTDKGQFHLDYINQSLILLNKGGVESFKIHKDFSLKLELLSFINSVIDDKSVVVSGQDGLKALRLALEIEQALSK